jgi:predicted Fe-Mo cluster-binding NifX family protein
MARIAISVTRDGEGMHALMDGRFGRAAAFLIVDRETGEVVETIDNASAGASHGAGIAAANTMKSAEVEAVISGRFGPKAFDALRALEIETWVAPSGITAGEALRMFDNGGLERM